MFSLVFSPRVLRGIRSYRGRSAPRVPTLHHDVIIKGGRKGQDRAARTDDPATRHAGEDGDQAWGLLRAWVVAAKGNEEEGIERRGGIENRPG